MRILMGHNPRTTLNMHLPTTSTGQFLHGAKDLRVETRPIPTPRPSEVIVAVRSTTLCGSDLHYYSHFRNGSILVREPLCLGHESAGEVVAVSEAGGKTHLKVGDRVALEVGVSCQDCELCREGRYNICTHLRFRSSGSKFPHYQGTLQEYVCHPANWLHPLPGTLDYEVGALLEPLAVAVQAVRRIKKLSAPQALDNILIFGAGAVGLLTAVAARAAGAKNIAIADIHKGRLDFAKEKGFASTVYAVEPKKTQIVHDAMALARLTAEEIGQLNWPSGRAIDKFNVVFECTGVASCVQASVFVSQSTLFTINASSLTDSTRQPNPAAMLWLLDWELPISRYQSLRHQQGKLPSFQRGDTLTPTPRQ